MPAPSPKSQLDGVSIIREGMNCGVQPRLLPKDQVAFAINVTFRGGLPKTRPVWRKMALTYADSLTEENATQALFQDAQFYRAYGPGGNSLISMIGGRVFRYVVGNGPTANVQDISIQLSAIVGGGGFTIPAVGSTVSVTVTTTTGWVIGAQVAIDGARYSVASITSGTVAVLTNLSGVPATVIAAGVGVIVYPDLNDQTNPDGWMWQSENFLIIANGEAFPLFFDGATLRRSLGEAGQEMPACCMGAYVQGRNWYVLPDRQSFAAGDLVYSHGFSDGYEGRAAVLGTTENQFLTGGGAFGVPVDAGLINAMSAVAIADTSLGQGSLQVMTQNSVFSVQVPLDRTEWAITQYPLMTVGLPNYGSLSQWATVVVNGDIWYRALDGIRSYQIGRRDQNTWVQTPLSVEVEKILQRDPEQFLGKASGILFNNRLMLTTAPLSIRSRGIAHWGLIVLDFNNISTLTSRSQPAYDGLWTGLKILKVLKGTFGSVERCFAFCLDCDGDITIWELLKDDQGYFDNDGSTNVPVESSFVSRSMGFSYNGDQLMRLQCGDLYLDRLAGNDTVDFAFKYRSDEDPFWNAWHSFQLCAPIKDCTTANCPTFQEVREQYRTYLRLPDPDDVCSPVTKRMTRTGYEFQTLMAWKGFIQLNRLHVWAEPIPDSVTGSCPTSEDCVISKGCDEPWFGYSIEGCPEPPTITIPPLPGPTPPTPPEPPTPPDPPNTPPAWPVPPVTDAPWLDCAGLATWGPIEVTDPVTLETKYVGIAPGMADPVTYIYSILGATQGQACIVAWSNAVWAAFVASGTAYTVAGLIWDNTSITNTGWIGWSVFPAQAGGYARSIGLDWTISVRYCAV